ncbi:MAG: sulfotransferase family protein [Gammaproteobacteria bacterium]
MKQQFTIKSMLRGLDGKLGEEDYVEPLEILIDSINKNNRFNAFGKIAFNHQLKSRLKVRRDLYQLHLNNKFSEPSDPVFVIGLPRSGTTFLFNLLSLDEAHRSPLYWEIMSPLPITKDAKEKDRRERKVNRDLKLARTLIPKLNSIHTIRANTPEECEQIATMNARSFVYMCMADVPEYIDYLKYCSFDSVFMWHKRFFQALELNGKPKRWLLKDPSHIGHIPEILQTYPNAKFVHIHRDPADSVGSFCSLTKNVRSAFSKKVNTRDIGKTVIDFWNHNLNKGMEDRKELAPDQIIDINYHDFIKSPLMQVKNIYHQLNFDMTIENENAIEHYLSKDQINSKPSHQYSLTEFGLDETIIKEQFRDYMLNYDF